MNEVVNTTADPAPAKNVKLIYILYLVSILLGLTSIIGLIMAYINKDDAPEWLQSHYQFLIRTFWIGLLYGVISIILMAVAIGFILILAVLVWFIIRCVKGMKLLDEGKPHPNPTSWMF
jgi:uncharacterized membrane protein